MSIFTSRIQRTGKGNIFTLYVSPNLDRGEGIPSQVVGGGYPITGLEGGTSSQVWTGGTPSQVWMGEYPIPGLDGGGYPRVPGLDRVPPTQDWMGYPPPPIRQSRIERTCYAAGGMPLAFTQEDFLVV